MRSSSIITIDGVEYTWTDLIQLARRPLSARAVRQIEARRPAAWVNKALCDVKVLADKKASAA